MTQEQVRGMNVVGYFNGIDPAACLIQNGQLVAFCEEERLLRYKHAPDVFPVRSIEACLAIGGIGLADVDAVAYGWDVPRYTNGQMHTFYEGVNRVHPPDAATRSWQLRNLGAFQESNVKEQLRGQLHKYFGQSEAPPLVFEPHHRSHAVTAFFFSPFDEALVFVLDGSGDEYTATLWHGKGLELDLVHHLPIPHSLGWVYAALTEYLGFSAYDGEYRVMGLAAYGRPNEHFRQRLSQVVGVAAGGVDWVVDPKYIHHGAHTYSSRFTDALVDLLGVPPRMGAAALTALHEDLAFETQHLLEQHVLRLLRDVAKRTGLKRLCLAGGVGLNVKMNSRIAREGPFEDVFVFPIPSDPGTAIGAASAHAVRTLGQRPEPLQHLYLGPRFEDHDIEQQLQASGIEYEKPPDIAEAVAELLAQAQVIAWVQGPMEAGPRALGARSILADPRSAAARDRVNQAVKFREYWRPFCPSLTEAAAAIYLEDCKSAPFMVQAYKATERAAQDVPAVVHVDGTVRPQTVSSSSNPLYFRLLQAFERRTGVAVLLNTSFNVKGEAMVCSPRDALRTFFSTGLDALAIGSFLVLKSRKPVATAPEDVLR